MAIAPPNILWLFCDELRADALSCYGNEHAQIATPHIDSIAADGVRFDRFYVDSPVCVSARAAYKSGLSPMRTGIYHNAGSDLGAAIPVESFTARLRRAGYLTVNLGKEHVPPELRGFDLSDKEGAKQIDLVMQAGAMRGRLGTITEGVGMNAATWPSDLPFPPEVLTDKAVRWLTDDRPEDRPWMLRVSYLQPHTPVIPPEPWASKYDDQPWPETFGPADGLSNFERNFGQIPARDLTTEQIVAAQSRYHGLVAWIDDQIGQLLAAVDRLGLRENTIIVFGSDHGAHLGELGGAYSKQLFTPWSQRVPFMVSWPGELERGVVNPELACSVDLGPTLLDLVGAERAEVCDGRALFSDPEPAHIVGAIGYGAPGVAAMAAIGIGYWPDGTGWPQRFCVRSRQWRYDRSTRREGKMLGADEHDAFLADTDADPREERNVISQHADIASEMEAILASALTSAVQISNEDYTAHLADKEKRRRTMLKEYSQ